MFLAYILISGKQLTINSSIILILGLRVVEIN